MSTNSAFLFKITMNNESYYFGMFNQEQLSEQPQQEAGNLFEEEGNDSSFPQHSIPDEF